jgi:hypothetical protein
LQNPQREAEQGSGERSKTNGHRVVRRLRRLC